jgi:hypothetical protein
VVSQCQSAVKPNSPLKVDHGFFILSEDSWVNNCRMGFSSH